MATAMISFRARLQIEAISSGVRSASGVMSSTRPQFAAQSCSTGGTTKAATASLSTTVYEAIMHPVRSA